MPVILFILHFGTFQLRHHSFPSAILIIFSEAVSSFSFSELGIKISTVFCQEFRGCTPLDFFPALLDLPTSRKRFSVFCSFSVVCLVSSINTSFTASKGDTFVSKTTRNNTIFSLLPRDLRINQLRVIIPGVIIKVNDKCPPSQSIRISLFCPLHYKL